MNRNSALGLLLALLVAATACRFESLPCPRLRETGTDAATDAAIAEASTHDGAAEVSVEVDIEDVTDAAPDGDMPMDVADASDAAITVDSATDAGTDATTDVPTAPLGSMIYRSVNHGDFWFCGEYPGFDPQVYGYRGCCTNGRWMRNEDFGRAPGIYAGTFVRTATSEVVFYIMERRDGRLARVVLPTSKVLITQWTRPDFADGALAFTGDPRGCAGVYEADEVRLNAMPIAGTALFRAGSTFTGVGSDPQRYIVGPNRTFHPIRFSGGPVGLERWVGSRANLLPDGLFTQYTIGAPIEVDASDRPLDVLARYASDERFVDLF